MQDDRSQQRCGGGAHSPMPARPARPHCRVRVGADAGVQLGGWLGQTQFGKTPGKRLFVVVERVVGVTHARSLPRSLSMA